MTQKSPTSQGRRCLDLTSAVAIVAASMIGAGVYTTSGFSIATADSAWTVVVLWIIGGFAAVCGAIGYAALSRRFTESGGEYLFLSKTLHPVAGVVAGWVSVLAGFTGPIALAALALDVYLVDAETSALPAGSIAALAIVAAAVLHSISVHPSARVQDVVVALKLMVLLGLVCFAATVGPSNWMGLQATDTPPFSWGEAATSLLYISFSYAGFNAAIYIAGEVKNPQRNVPMAMVIGTVVVAVLYIALNAAFVLIPSRESIAGQPDVATIAAGAIGGTTLETLVRWVIVVSLATSISALVMTGPRVYAKMADDGYLPRFFSFQHRVPLVAIWIQAVASIIVVFWTDLQFLLGYLSFTLMFCSALTVAMVWKQRDLDLWGSQWLPKIASAIFVLFSVMTMVVSARVNVGGTIAAFVTLAIGVGVYLLRSKSNTPDAQANMSLERKREE
ncbi:Serine/threonine exchanger SteT [Crateriforma conspicua]|uniref:Serine/threonine exchanger SteT n=1 Tax=Crateriforma conspicua TaxID=2527996 RepID=A0A5C6FSQ0_9PLAN|nr:amino acid permease [Crateriforma conspicua]TWU63191.1 Serine/threonine exchanger SteT [Crateriforma conspicua]